MQYFDISKIREKIKKDDYRFSDHAVVRMIERSIERLEIEKAIMMGEIIEKYPDDKYSPSCLIFGKTNKDRNLHVQLSIPEKVVVITCYEPDPKEWIDFKIRSQL